MQLLNDKSQSFLQVTLLGLWLVPVVISVYMIWWKFVLVSIVTD